MADRASIQGLTHLDPMFYIPDGATEFTYGQVKDVPDIFSDDELDGSDSEYSPYDDDLGVSDGGDTPPTPSILGVVSQTITRTAAGNEVVDVVIEVDDIDGVTNYQFRISKI